MLDISFYKNYPDLLGLSDKKLIHHWNKYGEKENRIGSLVDFYDKYSNFNWGVYLELYPDLKTSGVLTEEQAAIHYHLYGVKEGRDIYSYDELKLVTPYISLVFTQFYDNSLLKFISFDENTTTIVIEFIGTEYSFIINTMKELIGKIDNLFIQNSINNMTKPDYIIIIPVWERRAILNKVLSNYEKKHYILLVVSNLDDYNFAKENNYSFLLSSNRPLGRKINNAIHFINNVHRIKYKHLIISGSSNILSLDYINNSIENITEMCADIGVANKQILITDKNIYYRKFNYQTKKFFLSGLIFTRDAISKLDYKICSNNIYFGIPRDILKRIENKCLHINISDIPITSYYDPNYDININEMNQNKKTNIQNQFKTSLPLSEDYLNILANNEIEIQEDISEFEPTVWYPKGNNTHDLGSTEYNFKNIYANGISFGSTILTLPTIDGNSNEILKTDGAGTLSWTGEFMNKNTPLIDGDFDLNDNNILNLSLNTNSEITTTGSLSDKDPSIIPIDTSTNNITYTINTSIMNNGKILIFKDISGNASNNNITMETEGSEKIDGLDTFIINENYGKLKIFCNNNNWFVI